MFRIIFQNTSSNLWWCITHTSFQCLFCFCATSNQSFFKIFNWWGENKKSPSFRKSFDKLQSALNIDIKQGNFAFLHDRLYLRDWSPIHIWMDLTPLDEIICINHLLKSFFICEIIIFSVLFTWSGSTSCIRNTKAKWIRILWC